MSVTPPNASPAQAPDGRPNGSGEWIVVVEDDRHTRQALERFLRREGLNPITFASAAELHGWLEAAPGSVAAAVIDIHLPDADGIELTRLIRDRAGEDVKIVIVSGDTSMQTLARIRDAGGDRFVGKPMSLAALKEALGQAGAGHGSEA